MKVRRMRYTVANRTLTTTGQRLQLKLLDCQAELPSESKRLTVNMTQFALNTARLRIFDPSKKEFEPPEPVVNSDDQASIVNYKFALKDSGSLVIAPNGKSEAQFEVHLQSTLYADKVRQLAIGIHAGQFFYGLRGQKGAPFAQAGRWSKHTFYSTEGALDYEIKEEAGVFEGTDPFIIVATKDVNISLGLFFFTGHDIDLTLSSERILTFRTTGGLLDVFFFFGPDPTSVAEQYFRLVGFPSLPSIRLLTNGLSISSAYTLDGSTLDAQPRDLQASQNAPDILPKENGTQRLECTKHGSRQLFDVTHPKGAQEFHEFLIGSELDNAIDYRGNLIFRRPHCVSNGSESAHTLTLARYSDLRNAYAAILAKATYRSVAKKTGEIAQILVQSTFPGTGRWSGYWNPERRPQERTVQDMLLHNIAGLPVYGAAVCNLRDVVDANASEECCRLAHVAVYFPLHRRMEANEIGAFYEKPMEDSPMNEYQRRFRVATSRATRLRASFLPYTLTALYQCHKTGAMLARPMSFEFPRDYSTHDYPEQFMYGPHLLVIARTEFYQSTKLLEAYFPSGLWYEPYRGRYIRSSGQVVFVPRPAICVTPVFVRAGSIVPVAKKGGIRLAVFLDADEQAEGDLFQLPKEVPELEALAAKNYSLFHFLYVKGSLTGHCTTCAVSTMLSSIRIYGLNRRPAAVDINGRQLYFNVSGWSLTAYGVAHDATSPFLITIA
ncbi:hypothetical protein HPB50_024340 [Hyalomma asiaticum]|uniref:Uncharacterized protein n=1 Tax=Hyalomma asiaticum TaxID=266040 RepID=A0ACB7TDV3_HYAAI|nr:hypothetical protein HPB50_024340 [Hyalomma asiaticum]